ERDETGDDETRHGVKNRLECRLIRPAGCRWNPKHKQSHQRQNGAGEKAEPDRAPRCAVTINLSENIDENVSDREKQLRAAHIRGDRMAVKIEERNRANFLSDQIRNQENDDEDMDEQIVKAKAAQPRIARR